MKIKHASCGENPVDLVTFESTGRTIETEDSVFGITDYGFVSTSDQFDDVDQPEPLTPEERRELAAHMMRRWARYGGLDMSWAGPNEVGLK